MLEWAWAPCRRYWTTVAERQAERARYGEVALRCEQSGREVRREGECEPRGLRIRHRARHRVHVHEHQQRPDRDDAERDPQPAGRTGTNGRRVGHALQNVDV
jgi:hypothetical protein